MYALMTFSLHCTTVTIWPCVIHESLVHARLRDMAQIRVLHADSKHAAVYAGAGSSDHMVHSTRASHSY